MWGLGRSPNPLACWVVGIIRMFFFQKPIVGISQVQLPCFIQETLIHRGVILEKKETTTEIHNGSKCTKHQIKDVHNPSCWIFNIVSTSKAQGPSSEDGAKGHKKERNSTSTEHQYLTRWRVSKESPFSRHSMWREAVKSECVWTDDNLQKASAHMKP